MDSNKFRAFVENANDIIYSLTLDGVFTYVSPNWKDILGHDSADVVGKSFAAFVHPEDVPLCREFLGEVVSSGKSRRGVRYRVKHLDGSWRWHTSNGSALKNTDGTVEEYIGIARDITDQVEAEEALKIRVAYEEALSGASRALLNVIDKDQAITEALRHLLNASDAKRVYIFENFSHPADGLCMRQKYEVCAEGVVPQLDNPLLQQVPYFPEFNRWYDQLSKNRPVWGRIKDFPEKEREVLEPQEIRSILVIPVWVTSMFYGFIGFDETDHEREWEEENVKLLHTAAEMIGAYIFRKQAEIDIKASEEKFQQLFRNNPALMALMSSPEGAFIDVNDTFLDKLGFTKEGVLGKTALEMNLHVEPAVDELIRQELKSKGRVENLELNIRKEDGSLMEGLLQAEYIETQGQTTVLNVMTDITAQKRAEEAAKEASRAKSEFLANMSHEIRTPLNGIVGFTDLLLKTNLTGLQREYMEHVAASADILMGLINDILDFSKIEAGKLELDYVETNIVDLCEKAMEVVKYRAHEKGLELLLNLDPDIPRFVNVDAIRLRQVLMNLLSNSVKFTEAGEIELKVRLGLHNSDKNNVSIHFAVRDTGIGISTHQQKTIFESFSQADPSTTRKYGGTGLGLSISNRLLEMMGDSLHLESELGRGSIFSFRLNLNTVSKSKGEQALAKIETIKRVLVIDDNHNNRIILQNMLRYFDITTEVASEGIEGLRRLQANPDFDVIIVDYHMPFMNGLDVVQKIREEVFPSVEKSPIILLHSSSDDPAIFKRCKELKITYKLVKPVKMTTLFETLHSLESAEPHRKEDNEQVPSPELAVPFQLQNSLTVLIAEDDRTNMLLTKVLLARIFPHASLLEAYNGVQAVELYQQHRPDLVLMDIQMPEKDGYTAAREIRAVETGTGDRTTGRVFERRAVIIALTAGTVKGEKERCLNAGMDDYLSKPVVEDRLREVLLPWLTKTEKAEEEPPHFDRDALMTNLTSDEELLEELIGEIKKTLPQRIAGLQESLEQRDYEKLRSYAHSLKGVSLNMKFYILADLSKKLEDLAVEATGKHTIEETIADTVDTTVFETLVIRLKQEATKVLQLLDQE